MCAEEYTPKKIPKFTQEEDRMLTYLIIECKHTNWVTIASLMPGRNVKQCRERWRHVLCKKASNTEWTPEEDKLLMEKFKELGRKWNHIQTSLPNHTVVQVKNRVKFLINEDPHPRKNKVKITKTIPAKLVLDSQRDKQQIEIKEPASNMYQKEVEVPVKIIGKQILPIETKDAHILEKSSIDAFDSLFNSLNMPFKSRESSIDWFGVSQDNISNFWG